MINNFVIFWPRREFLSLLILIGGDQSIWHFLILCFAIDLDFGKTNYLQQPGRYLI